MLNHLFSMKNFLNPIGVIHSVFKSRQDCPRQSAFSDKKAEIELFPEFEAGLKDLESFSHIHVFYLLDKSDSYSLSVQTGWTAEPKGLFSTRTPNRPTPLGYSAVKVNSINGKRIEINGIDAVEGTKVLDIKPYIPEIDSKKKAKAGC